MSERERVEMGVGIDLTAGIRVVAPRAADPERPLEDREVVDARFAQLDARRDTSEAAADDRDPWSRGRLRVAACSATTNPPEDVLRRRHPARPI